MERIGVILSAAAAAFAETKVSRRFQSGGCFQSWSEGAHRRREPAADKDQRTALSDGINLAIIRRLTLLPSAPVTFPGAVRAPAALKSLCTHVNHV